MQSISTNTCEDSCLQDYLMSSCQAELAISQPKPFYTSGDYIAGDLRIVQDKEITVSEIIVKLIGEVYVSFRSNNTTYTHRSKIYEYCVRAFPPPELARHGLTQFTINAGSYRYPFCLKFPGHDSNALYPTYSTYEGHVHYFVKATVRRTSHFKLNTRAVVPTRTMPCTALEYLRSSRRFVAEAWIYMMRKRSIMSNVFGDKSKKPCIKGYLELRSYGVVSCATEPIGKLFLAKNEAFEGEVLITRIKVILKQSVLFSVPGRACVHRGCKFVIAEAKRNISVVFSGKDRVEVTGALDNIQIPESVTPSFMLAAINIGYTLRVELELTAGKAVRHLNINAPIKVLSALVHDHSPAEQYCDRIIDALTAEEGLPIYSGNGESTGDTRHSLFDDPKHSKSFHTKHEYKDYPQ